MTNYLPALFQELEAVHVEALALLSAKPSPGPIVPIPIITPHPEPLELDE